MAAVIAAWLAGCAPATTWADVAPVVEDRCVSCHAEGAVGPFPLHEYAQAAPLASVIAERTASRVMPPWLADSSGTCGQFDDSAWLTDDEIDLFSAWAADGGVEGRAIDPLVPPEPETLDADTILDIGTDYTPTRSPDEYRCFVVDGMPERRFLTAWQIEPGDPRIVHHVILYAIDDETSESAAAALDQRDEAPGYECFGSALIPARPVAAWAPGTPATALPEGTGVRLGAGRKLVVQVHYNVGAGAGSDRTRVHLRTAETVPNEAFVVLLGDLSMSLPPGVPEATTTYEHPLADMGLPLGVFLRGVYPHMHLRGRSLSLEVVHEGARSCAIDVPRWDFGWQRMYLYTDPMYVYPDDVLRLTCTFDTSADVEPVTWGEGTADEMCLAGLVVTLAG